MSLRLSSGDNGGCDRKLRAPGHLHQTSAPELFVGTSFPGRLLVNMGSGASLAAACCAPFCSPSSPFWWGTRCRKGGQQPDLDSWGETLKKGDSGSESCPAVVWVLPSCDLSCSYPSSRLALALTVKETVMGKCTATGASLSCTHRKQTIALCFRSRINTMADFGRTFVFYDPG